MFSLNRLMNFEQRFTAVAFIYTSKPKLYKVYKCLITSSNELSAEKCVELLLHDEEFILLIASLGLFIISIYVYGCY